MMYVLYNSWQVHYIIKSQMGKKYFQKIFNFFIYTSKRKSRVLAEFGVVMCYNNYHQQRGERSAFTNLRNASPVTIHLTCS